MPCGILVFRKLFMKKNLSHSLHVKEASDNIYLLKVKNRKNGVKQIC